MHLAKARQCLANARVSLGVALTSDSGRGAYLAAFHAAQAFIFERTGRLAKTHQGVQREFHRLAKGDTGVDPRLPAFLSQAYNLKAAADYEIGPDAEIPPARAAAAIETAGSFVERIAELLGP